MTRPTAPLTLPRQAAGFQWRKAGCSMCLGMKVIKATVPDGPCHQLVAGTWDSTAVLIEAGTAIEATAAKLPYVKGY